tara:strand:+ start:31 stop:429 length:399 start_codon:yes stop_codon:yes gene_type:complete
MANTKISALSALNEKPATDDILAIVAVTGTDTTKKITVANLFKSDLVGNVTGNLTGNVTGNTSGTSGTAATVTTAAQPAITSLGTLTSLKVATSTPANASATGTAGTIAWDTGYIYVCTATDTWKRVAIATW